MFWIGFIDLLRRLHQLNSVFYLFFFYALESRSQFFRHSTGYFYVVLSQPQTGLVASRLRNYWLLSLNKNISDFWVLTAFVLFTLLPSLSRCRSHRLSNETKLKLFFWFLFVANDFATIGLNSLQHFFSLFWLSSFIVFPLSVSNYRFLSNVF